MLTIYTRHAGDCDHRDDMNWRRCRCPKWIRGVLPNGRNLRTAAKTRSWEQAEKYARKLEAENDPLLPDEDRTPVRSTIHDAVELFLDDQAARGLESSSQKKYRTVLQNQLLVWMEKHKIVMLDQIMPADLTRFRATWRNGESTTHRKHEIIMCFFGFCVRNGRKIRIDQYCRRQLSRPIPHPLAFNNSIPDEFRINRFQLLSNQSQSFPATITHDTVQTSGRSTKNKKLFLTFFAGDVPYPNETTTLSATLEASQAAWQGAGLLKYGGDIVLKNPIVNILIFGVIVISSTAHALPVITALSSTAGVEGSTVTITGSGFGAVQGTSTVTFNGVAATILHSTVITRGISSTRVFWSDTSITALVPAAAGTGPVVVTAGGLASNGVNFVTTPVIQSLSPSTGAPGTTVTVTGTGFGNAQGSNAITFNGVVAAASSWSDRTIVVAVPASATTGNVVVSVPGGASIGTAFIVAPVILRLSASSARFGESVIVAGTSFGGQQGSSTITFNGMLGDPITWVDTSIMVPVPNGATPGNIVVTVNGVASNGVPFTPIGPVITGISPTSGAVHDEVTITGTGFGAYPGSYNVTNPSSDPPQILIFTPVTFNGIPAPILSWSDTSLQVQVPCGGVDGNVIVSLPVPGVDQSSPGAPRTASNPVSFSAQLLQDGVLGMEPVVQSGDMSKRAQLVILGDGYTQRDMDRFDLDVTNAVNGILNEAPFSSYESYFNIIKIKAASKQCGATHWDRPPYTPVQNYFGSNYGCGIQVPPFSREICTSDNDSRIMSTINSFPQLDNSNHPRMILLLVNDPQYGGKTGGSAKSYNGRDPALDMTEVVKHELGHQFGMLGDEYPTGGCHLGQANIGGTPDPLLAPWSSWIPPLLTPIQGACASNLFRPTQDSKMNHLGVPFYEVNSEQLVYATYSAMTFPDGPAQPESSNVTAAIGDTVTFEPAVPNPASTALQYTWSVDGTEVAGGLGPDNRIFDLDTNLTGQGLHAVSVEVEDETPLVRNTADRGPMHGSVNWSLNVTAECSDTPQVSNYDVSYTNSEEQACVDTHKVTDVFDCNGNEISSDDEIIDTECVTCSLAESSTYQSDPYDIPGGWSCRDDYEDDIYECTDGTSHEQLHFVQTECTKIELCEDPDDPECSDELDEAIPSDPLIREKGRYDERSLDSINRTGSTGPKHRLTSAITKTYPCGVSSKDAVKFAAPSCSRRRRALAANKECSAS